MKLSKAVEGFLLERAAVGRVAGTIRSLDARLRLLIQFLGDREVDTITRQDVTRFLAYLQSEYQPQRSGAVPAAPRTPDGQGPSKPIKATTLSNYHYAVSSFFRWAERELGLARPDTGIPRPRAKPEPVAPFTEAETRALLKVADRGNPSRRNTAIILALLDCGLRVGELIRLRVQDVNLASGELQVRQHSTGQKTSGRVVYLSRATRHAIWRYLAARGEGRKGVNGAPVEGEDVRADDALFADPKGAALKKGAVAQMLNRVAGRASVTGMHPHRFRHTFAIQYLRNGGDVFTLQRLLGHSTLKMVQNYLAISSADTQDAHRKASPVERWKL